MTSPVDRLDSWCNRIEAYVWQGFGLFFLFCSLAIACFNDLAIWVIGWHYCDMRMHHWRKKYCRLCNYFPTGKEKYPADLEAYNAEKLAYSNAQVARWKRKSTKWQKLES